MNTPEKSKPIKINNKNQKIETKYNKDEFNLKTNCFDPSKFSPPNDFIIKLNLRINHYSNLRSRLSE
jgi:hypothetical protein